MNLLFICNRSMKPMRLGTRHCMWPALMVRMLWWVSWLTTAPMWVSPTTKVSPPSTLPPRPRTAPSAWSSWSTTEPMSTSRWSPLSLLSLYLTHVYTFVCPPSFFWDVGVILFQSRDGKSPLHMTAVHGRFTRSQTLIQNGESFTSCQWDETRASEALGKQKACGCSKMCWCVWNGRWRDRLRG